MEEPYMHIAEDKMAVWKGCAFCDVHRDIVETQDSRASAETRGDRGG